METAKQELKDYKDKAARILQVNTLGVFMNKPVLFLIVSVLLWGISTVWIALLQSKRIIFTPRHDWFWKQIEILSLCLVASEMKVVFKWNNVVQSLHLFRWFMAY